MKPPRQPSRDAHPTVVGQDEADISEWLDGLDESVGRYLEASLASSTRKAYASDWRAFTTWCEQQQVDALPADPRQIARYLSALADSGLKAATIQRRVAGIARAHRDAGLLAPTGHPGVVATLEGIRRTIGTAPTKKRALGTDDILRILQAIDADAERSPLAASRDRALVLIGFAGGLRRSELTELCADDIVDRKGGIAVTIRRSKTDQVASGRTVGIVYGAHSPTCPIRAVRHWTHLAQINVGPLFRPVTRHGHVGQTGLTGRSIARTLKSRALAAGLDPKMVSGHSLRSGHATTAAQNGADDRAIMATTGHKDRRTLDGYVQQAQLLDDPSSGHLGL